MNCNYENGDLNLANLTLSSHKIQVLDTKNSNDIVLR